MNKFFLITLGVLFWAGAAFGQAHTTEETFTIDSDAAAGAAVIDTPGAGSITLGSDDVATITLNANSGLVFSDNGDSIVNSADSTFDFTIDEAGPVILTASDDAGTADITLDAGGAGAITIGSADVTSVSVVTDGGTTTIDGSVSAIMPVGTSAGGTLTLNQITMATATADYDLPDSCDSATGNWVTLVVADPSETASLTVSAAEDTIEVGGLNLGANDELDSPTAAATSDGSSITVVCTEPNIWFSTAIVGTWVDGDVPD